MGVRGPTISTPAFLGNSLIDQENLVESWGVGLEGRYSPKNIGVGLSQIRGVKTGEFCGKARKLRPSRV